MSVGLELKSDTDGIIRCSTKTSRPVCFTWVKVSGGGGNGGGGTFLCVGSGFVFTSIRLLPLILISPFRLLLLLNLKPQHFFLLLHLHLQRLLPNYLRLLLFLFLFRFHVVTPILRAPPEHCLHFSGLLTLQA